MKTDTLNFDNIVESIYSLPLDYKEELKSLLEHNIADTRRKEIKENHKTAQKHKSQVN